MYSSLSKKFPASAINASRALVAFPLFILVALLWDADGTVPRWAVYDGLSIAKTAWLLTSVVASYALGDVIFLKSAGILGVPAALAIASTYPFWSALAGWLLHGESLSPLKLAGLFLVVLGTVLVILNGFKVHQIEKKDSRPKVYAAGVALAFTTSMFWALNTVAAAEGGRGLSSAASNSARMAMAFLLSPCIGFLMTGTRQIVLPARAFLKALWVFVFEGFGGAFVFVYGLTHSPLAVGAALSSLAPVLSVPVALILGIETFSLVKTLGVVMVVGGIWFLVGT